LNALLRPVFDALLSPFAALPAWVGLAVVSLVVSVAMLLVYKRLSNQTKLEQVKRQIYAGIFEIRLFNDDFRAILRAQGEILRHNLRYLGYSLVPMAWMLVPLLLVVAQLQFHYGYEGLKPGHPTLLKVKLKRTGPRGCWVRRRPASRRSRSRRRPDSGWRRRRCGRRPTGSWPGGWWRSGRGATS
jgi:hypothetical protein